MIDLFIKWLLRDEKTKDSGVNRKYAPMRYIYVKIDTMLSILLHFYMINGGWLTCAFKFIGDWHVN